MKFTLILLADGHAILAPVGRLISADEARMMRVAWEEWKTKPEGVLILSAPVEVFSAREIELDLSKSEDAQEPRVGTPG